MNSEIEHKYLVRNDSYKGLATKSYQIKQGYLQQDKCRNVRIRVRDQQGFITIKGVTEGDARDEFEYEIPVEDAKKLLKMCTGAVLEKIRHIVPFEGNTWEVDEFKGALDGLTIAEIEIPTSNYEYSKPEFVGENVTGQIKYYNSYLAQLISRGG